MTPHTLLLPLATEDDTARLGRDLAAILTAGDCVPLTGGIGAGKTHLARALIRARTGEHDIPSPTFTLVQTYDGDPDIWHADLYRLSHPDEAIELGLTDAMATAITLIEWPDRLGDPAPDNALHIALTVEGEGRLATLTGPRARLDRLRRQQSRAMLDAAGWGAAVHAQLAGDASARRYARLTDGDRTAVLMDAPPRTGDDPADFVAIARHLRGLGLSAPDILAEDMPRGFLLLEDLGDDLYARLLDRGADETALHAAAADVLTHLHRAPAPEGLPDLSAAEWAAAIAPVFDWYHRCALGDRGDPAPVLAALTRALTAHADGPRVMILRDYHAENLLWLPDRSGVARVGLLDFQLAQMGQRGYDLVSLLQDARRDVPPEVEEATIRHVDPSPAFRAKYAVLGVQRNLRIIGIFAKLAVEGGKPRYLALIPRVWGYVQRNLAHPALAEVAAALDLPAPTPDILDRIARCRP